MLRTISCVSTSATDVGAPKRFGQRGNVAVGRELRLGGAEVRPAGRNDALAVAHDQIFGADAQRHIKLGARDGGRSGPVDDHLHAVDLLTGDLERIEQRGGRDDRRAVLVVVHDRDRELLFQALLDLETFGSLDVLEVDAAEGDRNILDRLDELLRIFRIHLDVEYVDVGERFEQKSFAFHNRLAGHRPYVAQSEHGRAVRNDCHQVALGRILVGVVGILLYGETRLGHARRVGQRKVFLGAVRFGRDDLDLARPPFRMVEKGLFFLAFRVVSHLFFMIRYDILLLRETCLSLLSGRKRAH